MEDYYMSGLFCHYEQKDKMQWEIFYTRLVNLHPKQDDVDWFRGKDKTNLLTAILSFTSYVS